MPRGNRTGPAGLGPLTGRGAGFCAGYEMPGYANHVMGRGFSGRGRGGAFGRGRRNMYWATGMPGWARSGYGPIDAGAYPFPEAVRSPRQEAKALKDQVKYMQDSMNALNERIKELENAQPESEE
jgi:hypothetical protein